MYEMPPESDAQLLRKYAECGAETAFTELVQRHANLVYSAALRQVESPDVAAEVAQRVFIGLAQGAQTLTPRLSAEATLAGWLCRSARNPGFAAERKHDSLVPALSYAKGLTPRLLLFASIAFSNSSRLQFSAIMVSVCL
jgi:DNA-directed RNA polymerase specialized sigma24 family protein